MKMKMFNQILILLFLLILIFKIQCTVYHDIDQYRSLHELVEAYDYELKNHTLETSDGYILTIHRLVHKNENETDRNQYKTVLLQHGIFGTSANFFINSPHDNGPQSNQSDTIAFALMQTNRFDLWFLNIRGNRYSRHRNYSSYNFRYWQFSLNEISLIDLPESIEYIRNVTRKQTISYIGASQGATTMFTLLSFRPEYAQIVQPFIALAPIAFVRYVRTPARVLAPAEPLLKRFSGQFLFTNPTVIDLVRRFCSLNLFDYVICYPAYAFGVSPDVHLNVSRVPAYLNFYPSTTSNWVLGHYAQMVNTGKFQLFNYLDDDQNMEHYGTMQPPDVPLANISRNAKIAFFQGRQDVLANDRDLNHLKAIFNDTGIRLIKDFYVSNQFWTHFDFIFGQNSYKFFIRDMIEVLDDYAF